MIIRLLPQQVPAHWNAIKYAALKANSIDDSIRQLYLNRLLNNLLSEKSQCFVRFNESRELLAVLLTRITVDDITGIKMLVVESLYSFKQVDDEEWKSNQDYIDKFARSEGCKMISTYTNNPRVYEIVGLIGFEERFRCFVKNLNGGK